MENFIKEISCLTKHKEDEITWSKTDNLLLKISEIINSKEDIQNIFPFLKELLIKSIMSDRSKLSGTALSLFKKIVDISSGQITNINEFLNVLFKICGRSNKVVSKRGQDGVVNLCKHIDLGPYIKIITEYVSSTNKNVRLSVFLGLEASFHTREIPKSFEKILQKGKEDPFLEARIVARRIKTNVIKEESESKPKIHSIFIPPVSVLKTAPSISHSPLRKIFKIENKVEKINAIEEKVKTIVNPKVSKAKIQKVVEPYKTRDLLQAIPKKEKVVHDDLTPKKLDKFLSKYRNVYGNLLEDNKNIRDGDIRDGNIRDGDGNKGEDNIVNNDNKNDDKYNKDGNNNIDILADYSEVIKDTQQENLEGLVESYEKLQVSIDTIEKEFGNLSIIDEDSEQPHFDFTVVNSEQSEREEVNKEEVSKEKEEICEEEIYKESIEEVNKENTEEVNKDEINIEEVNKKSTEEVNKDEINIESLNNTEQPSIHNSSTNMNINKPFTKIVDIDSNRFSPLLFADKDECIIFDINKGDTKFKTPSSSSNIKNPFTSPLDVPVVKNSLSSSFLYSKDDMSLSDDFTQIDSIIYVDKKTFTRTEE